MIKIFYGSDRVKIGAEVVRVLGKDYEVIEGAEIKLEDLPSIFRGASLFAEKRKILIKDMSSNAVVWEKILEYLDTEHEVVIWETALDKRTVVYRELVKRRVEMKEYDLLPALEEKLVFEIFDVALVDGPKAMKMVEKIENKNDPYRFVGLLATQAIKKWTIRPGIKEKRALKELSKLDIKMKTTSLSPWTLVKACLLQLA